MSSSSSAAAASSSSSDFFQDQILGLPCHILSCDGGSAAVTQQGAQVISWRDAQDREWFYLSPQTGGAQRGDALGMAQQAIRGGMPISFPQFSVRGPLLKHGFIRLQRWSCVPRVQAGELTTEQSSLKLQVTNDAQSKTLWAEAFHAELAVLLEHNRLSVTLSITNQSEQTWEFTVALHSYLRVNDILKTELVGLQNTHYQDATANSIEVVEQGERVAIAGEIDRVYMSPPASLHLLEDNIPTLRIEQSGFSDTVVWNPGAELVRTLTDFPDADWTKMLCVEAACASTPVLLQPGQIWQGTQQFSALEEGADINP